MRLVVVHTEEAAGAWIWPSAIWVTGAATGVAAPEQGMVEVTTVSMCTTCTGGEPGAAGEGEPALPAGGAGVADAGELAGMDFCCWAGEFGAAAWVAGTGANVIEEGTFTTRPGFCGICSAQMAARNLSPPAFSSSFCAQAVIQSCTVLVKS